MSNASLTKKRQENFKNGLLKIDKLTLSFIKQHYKFTDMEISKMVTDGRLTPIKIPCCYECGRQIPLDNLTTYVNDGCMYCGYVDEDDEGNTTYTELDYYKYNK